MNIVEQFLQRLSGDPQSRRAGSPEMLLGTKQSRISYLAGIIQRNDPYVDQSSQQMRSEHE